MRMPPSDIEHGPASPGLDKALEAASLHVKQGLAERASEAIRVSFAGGMNVRLDLLGVRHGRARDGLNRRILAASPEAQPRKDCDRDPGLAG